MKFGTYHTFQVPPWITTEQIYAEEFERVDRAEALGYDSVWVPEQHFFDYCACPDVIDMSTYLLGRTCAVRVGAAVVNQSLTHPLRFAERAALLDRIGDAASTSASAAATSGPRTWCSRSRRPPPRRGSPSRSTSSSTCGRGSATATTVSSSGFPPVRTWPAPIRRPEAVLLMSVGGTTPIEETVERGPPLALASPFVPVSNTADIMRGYGSRWSRSPASTPT